MRKSDTLCSRYSANVVVVHALQPPLFSKDIHCVHNIEYIIFSPQLIYLLHKQWAEICFVAYKWSRPLITKAVSLGTYIMPSVLWIKLRHFGGVTRWIVFSEPPIYRFQHTFSIVPTQLHILGFVWDKSIFECTLGKSSSSCIWRVRIVSTHFMGNQVTRPVFAGIIVHIGGMHRRRYYYT